LQNSSHTRELLRESLLNQPLTGTGLWNGNKYLAWAFSEASELSRRFDSQARAYFNRKASKSNRMVAHNALAHKLARAAYYIIKDQVTFMPEKLFAS